MKSGGSSGDLGLGKADEYPAGVCRELENVLMWGIRIFDVRNVL